MKIINLLISFLGRKAKKSRTCSPDGASDILKYIEYEPISASDDEFQHCADRDLSAMARLLIDSHFLFFFFPQLNYNTNQLWFFPSCLRASHPSISFLPLLRFSFFLPSLLRPRSCGPLLRNVRRKADKDRRK